MSSNYGRNLRLSVFGQSHGAMIGAVIDGLPVGEEINIDELQQFVDRRSPGRDEYSTSRKEPDRVEITSGSVSYTHLDVYKRQVYQRLYLL